MKCNRHVCVVPDGKRRSSLSALAVAAMLMIVALVGCGGDGDGTYAGSFNLDGSWLLHEKVKTVHDVHGYPFSVGSKHDEVVRFTVTNGTSVRLTLEGGAVLKGSYDPSTRTFDVKTDGRVNGGLYSGLYCSDYFTGTATGPDSMEGKFYLSTGWMSQYVIVDFSAERS